MGAHKALKPRVVFDTTVVVSALVFKKGQLAWLREHWREGGCVPLIARETAAELTFVLEYPKFSLSVNDRRELLAEYLPYCEVVGLRERCPSRCRDAKDQAFLDLAQSGKGDLLVSGDKDLLALAGKTKFVIESPEAYRRRIFPSRYENILRR
jgi:putative PIN family toxin of toxin-antitoxin system